MNYFKCLSLIGLAVVALGGCTGYQLGPIKPSYLADVQTLAVPTFKNETLEPRIQSLTTNAVIKQIQKDGSYSISSEKTADAVVHGTITTIERRQLRSTRTDVLRTRELEVIVTIDYVVQHNASGAELAKGNSRGRTNVFLDPNFQLTERQAIQQAVQEAAINLVNNISEGY